MSTVQARTLIGLGVALAAGLLVPGAHAKRPPTPPPRVSGAGSAPPPAWVEFGARSRWLAYSSYCWTTEGRAAACVDFIPPLMRPDVPVIAVERGTRLRFRLGFRPTSVKLLLLGPGPRRTWTLAASASTTWRAVRAGVFLLEAKGAGGSAGYALRLRLR
jgi:hypothetical protein